MFAPTRYLHWARRFYGQVTFDLASSGIACVPASELPPPVGGADDANDPARGWADLCRRIAAHNDVNACEALPALGTTHALWLACAATLSPGDDALVEHPVYEPLVRIAEGCGARVRHFTRDAGQGFTLDPERIEAALTPSTKLVIVSDLHNPSGIRTRPEVLAEVASRVEAQGARLLVDEVYAEFDARADASGVFRGSARKLGANVIAVSSLTKYYGLGPERIGWVLGPPDVVERGSDALLASAGHLPRSYVAQARAAFDALPALGARTRALLGGKRERVARWLASMGLSWSEPAEGLFGLVTVPGGKDLTPLIEAAVAERQVLVAPGAFFGVPSSFRIAWSIASERLDEGLQRLGDALRG